MRLARSKAWKGALAILALVVLASLGVGVVVGAGLSVWRGSSAQRAVGVLPDRALPVGPRVVTVPHRPAHPAPKMPRLTPPPAAPAPAPVPVHRVKPHRARVATKPASVPVPAAPAPAPRPVNPAGHPVAGHPAGPALAHWRELVLKVGGKLLDEHAKTAATFVREEAHAAKKLAKEQAKATKEQSKQRDKADDHGRKEHWTCKRAGRD